MTLIQLKRTNKNSSNHIRGKLQIGASDIFTTKDGVIQLMLCHPVEVFSFLGKYQLTLSLNVCDWSAATFPDLHGCY